MKREIGVTGAAHPSFLKEGQEVKKQLSINKPRLKTRNEDKEKDRSCPMAGVERLQMLCGR